MTNSLQIVSPNEVTPHDSLSFTPAWKKLCQEVTSLDEAWWHKTDLNQAYPYDQISTLFNDFLLNHFPEIGHVILPLPTAITASLCLDFEQAGWLIFTAHFANSKSPRNRMNYRYFILQKPA